MCLKPRTPVTAASAPGSPVCTGALEATDGSHSENWMGLVAPESWVLQVLGLVGSGTQILMAIASELSQRVFEIVLMTM